MLYLILPPIIIIATLVLLVYFFSRRFPQVEKEIAARMNDEASPENSPNIPVVDTMKRASLFVLERLAQWFKVMALKIYNSLHQWTQSLREKKAEVSVKSPVEIEDRRIDRGDAAEKVPSPAIERRIRPMVSQRLTRPEDVAKPPVEVAAPAMKNQLEDILVERIAANPRDIEAYERLGEYYMEQGNTQDAKECYRQVLRLSPVHRLAKIKIRRLEKMLEQK